MPSSSLVLMYMSSLLQKLALMVEWVLMHLLLSEDLGTAVLGKQLKCFVVIHSCFHLRPYRGIFSCLLILGT